MSDAIYTELQKVTTNEEPFASADLVYAVHYPRDDEGNFADKPPIVTMRVGKEWKIAADLDLGSGEVPAGARVVPETGEVRRTFMPDGTVVTTSCRPRWRYATLRISGMDA